MQNHCASQELDYHTEDGIFVAEEKILRLLNRQFLLRTGSCCQGSEAVLVKCKLLPVIPFQLREKNFSENYDTHFIDSVCSIDLEILRQNASYLKLVIIPPFSLGEKGCLWISDPIQVAFEVATRLRAKKLIVLDTFTLPNFDNTDSSQITKESISKWLEKQPDLPPVQKIQLTALTESCVRVS